MMEQEIVLFEDDGVVRFLPLTYWRCVFELRHGRKILLDRIAQSLGRPVSGFWTRERLAPIAAQRCGAPANVEIGANTVLVSGRWLPEPGCSLPTEGPAVGMIGDEVAYIVCGKKLAAELTPRDLLDRECRALALQGIPTRAAPGTLLRYPWDCITALAVALREDWSEGDTGADSVLPERLVIEDATKLHVGERSTIHPTASINTLGGPVYISHNVSVGAHAIIEGPAYIGPGCKINPQAWLHGGVSLGPVCKVGGEIDACIMLGYTNKQHSGFLGHAYVGNWVNIGAGTCNSDLKNTYGTIRASVAGKETDTGLQFFGAIIGDHVKIGINAAIPTGAVLGFAGVINTAGLMPKTVKSFSWITSDGVSAGDPGRMLDVATKVMARRNIDMTDDEIELFLDLPGYAQTIEG